MLNATQIESLRAKVRAAQRRPMAAPWVWGRFLDGPLADLEFKVNAGACENPKSITSWCEITERGPVIACYSPNGSSDEWCFKGYDRPGARASGIE